MDERKAKQPLGESSAGCAFKNWDFEDESELEILKREIPEVPESMLKAKRISAGWFIDQADMLGASLGDVAVSEKHGNFMVNKGKAKASDVIALISRVKMKVRDTFGIELEEEVQLIGF
jgi:UDP-N-acetylmuramate dehydrogenase